MKTKICYKCKKERCIGEFSKDKHAKDGLQNKCKNCVKQHYLEHREEISLNGKQYYIEHKEESNFKSKKWYWKHKEESKLYHKKYVDTNIKILRICEIFSCPQTLIGINWLRL